MTFRSHGFTLIEMAVVLVIVGLMLGGLLVPLSIQMETDKRKETAATLVSIREALIGFAIINNRFPCPDANNDGLANDSCTSSYSAPNPPGRLPFASLGVSATDAWNRPWTYMVNGGFTGTFSLGSAGSGVGRILISSVAGCGSAMLADDVAAVVISEGKNDITTSALEQENNDTTNSCFVSAGYTQGANGFDDQLVWIPRGTLFSRMVAAGKPPAP